MFLWLILYNTFFTIISSNSSQLLKTEPKTFLSKKYGDDRYLCVTASSSALTWIYQKKHLYSDNRISSSIPMLVNGIDCSISEFNHSCHNYYVSKLWLVKKSLESEIILDRRWEAMKIEETLSIFNIGSQNSYTVVEQLSERNFNIPFSVLAENDIHIFLCDGSTPSRSNCFWFMLNTRNGKISAVRKCDRYSIPNHIGNYPRASCNNTLVEVIHNDTVPFYITEKYWSHFNIVKNETYLILKRIVKNEIRNIWEIKDSGNIINVTHMVVHSKLHAFWKIHNLNYIYTTEEHSTNLGPPIKDAFENSVCISMFVSMCTSCSLKIEFIGRDGKNVLAKEYRNKDRKWYELKVVRKNVQNFLPLQMKVTTVGNHNDSFWAIDDVKQCQTVYRMIRSNYEAKCQSMDYENNVISLDLASSYFNDIKCPENTTSHLCLPCKWLNYNNCRSITTCFQTSTRVTQCVCSAGFQNVASSCSSTCDDGYYGHGCINKCGECTDGLCDHVNGSCNKKLLFEYVPPEVLNVGSTEAVISINDFNRSSSNATVTPLFYRVQYKKTTDKDNNWRYIGTSKSLDEINYFTINNLTANTKYEVRCVISSTKNFSDDYYSLPISSFTTKCPALLQDDIHINPSDTSISVELVWPNTTCETKLNDFYNITLSLSSDFENGTQKPEGFKSLFQCKIFMNYLPISVVIGSGSQNHSCEWLSSNEPLESGKHYFILLVINRIFGYETEVPLSEIKVYTFKTYTYNTQKKSGFGLFALLFLIIPIFFIIYITRRKLVEKKKFEPSPIVDKMEMMSLKTRVNQKQNVIPENVKDDLGIDKISKPIELEKYQKYVKVSKRSGELDRQYSVLLNQVSKTIYEKISEFYDYIDMEYVNGTKLSESYIVTEVPREGNGIADFWKHVSEDNVKLIVLFGSVDPKTNIYWPEQGVKIRCDKTLVEIATCKVFQHHTYRKFILIDNDRTTQVEQLHCTYDGFYPRKFVSFFRKILKFELNSCSPILVHSTIGIGGVGFVLLCDICLRTAEKEKIIDVMGAYQKLKKYRTGMIRSPEQYKLVHEVISDTLFSPTFNLDLPDDYTNY